MQGIIVMNNTKTVAYQSFISLVVAVNVIAAMLFNHFNTSVEYTIGMVHNMQVVMLISIIVVMSLGLVFFVTMASRPSLRW